MAENKQGKKQGKNVALLLFLSDYKFKKSDREAVSYFFFDGDKYEGAQTNDAPVECLLKMALAKSAGLEKLEPNKKIKLGQDKKLYILCITSYKVMTGDGKKAWDYFQNNLRKLQEKYIEKDEECKQDSFEIIPIPYDYQVVGDNCRQFTEEDEDTNQMAQRIFGDISDKLTQNVISDVYVDYTGGMRDISFLMTTIVRYLEFEGINCQKIVYSQYDRDNPEYNRIRDITYIYEMFQMINGVNEFVTTGRANTLNEVFKLERDKAGDRGEKEEHAEVKKLLENMVAFSKDMSICDVRNIDEYLANIRDSIGKLKPDSKNNDSENDCLEDTENIENQDLKIAMLKKLLPLMKEKLYLDRLGQNDYYIKLIKWCLENNMLQQALTLIEDKMPKAYVGEEGSGRAITYKFVSVNMVKLSEIEEEEDRNSLKNEFMDALGNKWEREDPNKNANKIFYRLDGKRPPEENSSSGQNRSFIPNILSNGICNEYYDILKELVENQDPENVLGYKYNNTNKAKNKVRHSVLKCLGNNVEYEVTDEVTKQTKTAEITVRRNNGTDKEKLKRLFYLHNILKQERNDCNHASDGVARLSFDALRILIANYVEKAEEVL